MRNPLAALLLALSLLGGWAQSGQAASVRERILFDDGWLFAKGDPAGAGDRLSYREARPWVLPTANDFLDADRPKPARPAGSFGEDVAYAQTGFGDGAWRRLDLPHDWGIEGPFQQALPGETGKRPWWGVAWYRKHFMLPASDRGHRLHLEVDGAMSYAEVWINGHFVGGWPYGYASWEVDLTSYVNCGGENVIVVRLDNPPDSSRWYPGGGIFRNVWLTKTSPIHVAHWGTFVVTPSVSPDAASVYVETTVANDTGAPAGAQVATALYELDGQDRRSAEPVAQADPTPVAAAAAGREILLSQSLTVPRPKLWSLRAPQRYVAVTRVISSGQVVDEYETPFGIRTIAFTADHGFLLNGRRVPIQGVCDHHDLGALGAALNVHALERQLRLLRDMGCNAIRTSHNPPAPELVDLCDRLGLLVMDEAFDCWEIPKRPNDYHLLFPDWHEQDLRALVRRDRNHPSVVLWSIGNEIPEQLQPEGWKLATRLAALVREEDRTRPTVSACNKVESGYNGFQVALDVVGYNYKPAAYPAFHRANPQVPILGSETASTVSTRGEYFFPVKDDQAAGRAGFQVSSYDLYAPPWAHPPDVEFRGLDQAPFAAGEFVWTGFDYLGEPTPYNASADPSRSSYFGIIDLAGFKKDRFFLYQARWRPDLPMAHILPHWDWPERVGQVTPVHVYTSGDDAELFLNGRSLGRRTRSPGEYRLRWDDVVYEPGELRVVAYKKGKHWAEDVVRTAGPAAGIGLTADRAALSADGRDLAFVTVAIQDRAGLTAPRAANRVSFRVDGPGEIVATDNGDPTCLEPFQEADRAAFHGLALVIVRTEAGRPGAITLQAESPGLAPAEIQLASRPPPN